MRRLITLSLLILVSATPTSQPTTRPAAAEDGITVYFSPDGNCTWAIVDQIDRAKRTIDVQAYAFTSVEIARALADAHDRGVKVRAVLDRQQNSSKYSAAALLLLRGVPVWLDGKHAKSHNKITIIDGKTVLTGSFNYSSGVGSAQNLGEESACSQIDWRASGGCVSSKFRLINARRA